MNLKEILQRASPITYSYEEVCYVLEEYIRIRKSQNIKVNPMTVLNNIPLQLHNALGLQEINKLNNAFYIALEWFYKNNYHV